MSLSSRFSTLTRQTETTGTLTSAHGLLQTRPPLGSISELSQTTSSFYPSCATSTTAETNARFNGPSGPLPPFLPPPLYPESVLPKDETDIVLRLSDWEIRQLVTPIRRGIIMGDSVLMIRDLASDVMVKMRASEVMRILEENDLYTPSVTVFDSINSGSLKSLSSDEGFGSLSSSKGSIYSIPRAIYVPPPKNRTDLLNRLTEREVREMLAPVKSGVLTDETIFSVADAITDMRFAVSAAELMKLFPEEGSMSSGYDTISHKDLGSLSSLPEPEESTKSSEENEAGTKWCTAKKAIILMMVAVGLIGVLAVSLALALHGSSGSGVVPSTTMSPTSSSSTQGEVTESITNTSVTETTSATKKTKPPVTKRQEVPEQKVQTKSTTATSTTTNAKHDTTEEPADPPTTSETKTTPYINPNNYCGYPITVNYNGTIIELPLCLRGSCKYTGNVYTCNCDSGWKGAFCDQVIEDAGFYSQRCIAYESGYPTDTKYRCNLVKERCIPDDIDCMFNTAPATDSKGKKYCPDQKRVLDGYCKCKNSIGWCLRLEVHGILDFEALPKPFQEQYVNPVETSVSENYCQNPIPVEMELGKIAKDMCGLHGKCMYNPVERSNWCQCDQGYSGKFCERGFANSTVYFSQRCITYENPDYTGDVTYRCDLEHERCIPDIICIFNIPPATNGEGQEYCPDDSRSDGVCKCKIPEGWCFPMKRS